MQKFFIIVVIALSIALIALYIKGSESQEIVTEVEINAAPEKVWDILKNVNQWQEWSPIIYSSSGVVEDGATVDITMKDKDGGAGPRYTPKIIELEQPLKIRWRAHMLSGVIFTNDKLLEITPTSSGSRLVHKEIFTGILAPIFCSKMEEGVPPMLEAMNQALKELAEAP